MDILRFITAGSVDDGKSTLTGRLLYDTGNIADDILGSISGANAAQAPNLAHLTDGLRSEREQGITIDVAYKYFTTPERKYIITDAPGHYQYTKNLVTGASLADAIIILIDAVNGITAQTRRHTLAAWFLRIPHIVVAVNKMDLVGYDESVYDRIRTEYLLLAKRLELHPPDFIPMCALNGDNVTRASAHMGWYKGGTLMAFLESCNSDSFDESAALRIAVQGTNETGSYCKVLCGAIKKGGRLVVSPGGGEVTVQSMLFGFDEAEAATAGQNIHLTFEEGAVLKRGDLLSEADTRPTCGNSFEAEVCWMDAHTPLQVNRQYIMKVSTQETLCRVMDILYKISNDAYAQYNDGQPLAVNEFARVKVETNNMIAYDAYATHRETGRSILIDTETNNTLGAFVIG